MRVVHSYQHQPVVLVPIAEGLLMFCTKASYNLFFCAAEGPLKGRKHLVDLGNSVPCALYIYICSRILPLCSVYVRIHLTMCIPSDSEVEDGRGLELDGVVKPADENKQE